MFFWDSLDFLMMPVDVGNLISSSPAFSKSSLTSGKSSVHVLLKPCLENFEHYFASMWDESNCAIVWAFFGIAFLWDWKENWFFPVLWPCWVFQTCWHTECNSFTASSFRIWNSSTGSASPPLALFVMMLPKAHLTSYSRMSGSRWVITPSWLSELWSSVLYSSSVPSLRNDWFVLLAVQGILKSLLQHHGLKASLLQISLFFWSSSHICTWLLGNRSFDYMALCQQSDIFAC